MALLVWVFSRIPTARFWILVFWPRQLFEAAVLPLVGSKQKLARKPPGVLLLVASGASKIMLIYQSFLIVVKLFIDSLKKKHPSTCNAVRNRQILCYEMHVFNHEAVPAQILNDQHRGKALLLRCLSIRSTNQHHRIL